MKENNVDVLARDIKNIICKWERKTQSNKEKFKEVFGPNPSTLITSCVALEDRIMDWNAKFEAVRGKA